MYAYMLIIRVHIPHAYKELVACRLLAVNILYIYCCLSFEASGQTSGLFRLNQA